MTKDEKNTFLGVGGALADLHTSYAHAHCTNDLQVVQNEVLQLCDAATLKIKTMGQSKNQEYFKL